MEFRETIREQNLNINELLFELPNKLNKNNHSVDRRTKTKKTKRQLTLPAAADKHTSDSVAHGVTFYRRPHVGLNIIGLNRCTG